MTRDEKIEKAIADLRTRMLAVQVDGLVALMRAFDNSQTIEDSFHALSMALADGRSAAAELASRIGMDLETMRARIAALESKLSEVCAALAQNSQPIAVITPPVPSPAPAPAPQNGSNG